VHYEQAKISPINFAKFGFFSKDVGVNYTPIFKSQNLGGLILVLIWQLFLCNKVKVLVHFLLFLPKKVPKYPNLVDKCESKFIPTFM
jgi:hypothetical protein